VTLSHLHIRGPSSTVKHLLCKDNRGCSDDGRKVLEHGILEEGSIYDDLSQFLTQRERRESDDGEACREEKGLFKISRSR